MRLVNILYVWIAATVRRGMLLGLNSQWVTSSFEEIDQVCRIPSFQVAL